MRVVDGSPAPYRLASSRKAAQSQSQSAAEGLAAAPGLSVLFCYRYFEVSTILLHLFSGLGLVISDLNYSQAA